MESSGSSWKLFMCKVMKSIAASSRKGEVELGSRLPTGTRNRQLQVLTIAPSSGAPYSHV